MDELQAALQWDDSYLPFRRRAPTALTQAAAVSASAGDPEALRDGWDRPLGDQSHAWDAEPGAWVAYSWPAPVGLRGLRLVFDSDLSRTTHNMVSFYTQAPQNFAPPPGLVRRFTVETRDRTGAWTALPAAENHQRLVFVAVGAEVSAIRVRFDATWGSPGVRVFALDAY